jgi:polygalacturonase
VTRGGLVHDMTYRNICMRDVEVPIAISPYYNNGTIDQFFDPGFKGDRIPDYKAISIEHVLDLTPGDVLIAGYDEAHRTEVNLVDVTIKGIMSDKVHLKFASIGNGGTNIPLVEAGAGKEVKLLPINGKTQRTPFSCDGRFVPMQ